MIRDRTSVFPKAFIELTLGLSDVLKVALFTFCQLHNFQTLKSNYYHEDLPSSQLLNELTGQKYRLISTILQDVYD